MDAFDHPYYRLNKRLLLLVGQWPYQDSSEHHFRVFIVTLGLLNFIFPQITLLCTSNGDVEIIIESMAPISALMVCAFKYYTIEFKRDKIKELLEHLIDNWKLCRTREELEIMHKFGRETKLLTFWYTIPLNESRSLKPIFKGEYFINEDENFFPIYFHMSVTIVIAITTLITADNLFLMCNSHICGIFAAVGFRLENFLKDQTDSISSLDHLSNNKCLETIRYSIRNHANALKFAELIESCFSISLLLQAGLSLICMSISLYQILIVLKRSAESVRFVIFALAQLIHLFCMCYPGQRMIDYSTDIRIKAYNGLWYKAPLAIHKLLILIIRKSLEPSCLTAGKIFVFCLESFATV
ncbi:hypothetical protein M0804_010736 [Polistes exclamans]|nr:hypothetical protein M0804_010736 [Polistes exclamans]